ncbi:MAG: hypothetical protein IT564_02090 [Rhodospirillales bacterium]|nr:hypothetical protein [Rhodospirillales bacterium]
MTETITRVEVERIETSLWGQFWEIQRTAPSATPMSRFTEFAGSLESWMWPQATVFVRIETASGHVGIGWAEDGVGAASNAIKLHLQRFVLGRTPDQHEAIWEMMFRASIPYGRKGAALEAISAIDLALWDLRARIAGVPVWRLLGAATARAIPAYASHLQPVSHDRFVAEAVQYASDGYTAMKMRMPGHPGHGTSGIDMNVERVRLVRDAVGDKIELMVDAFMGWDLPFAKRMARALEPYRVGWIEEPLLPDDIAGYAELQRESPVAIATGEHEFTRYGFEQLIRAGAARVLQPDVHRAGGLSEVVRICKMAQDAGLAVAPHVFSAPTVHLVTALPVCAMVEHLTIPCWASASDSPEPLLVGTPQVIAARTQASEAAGWGVTLNENANLQFARWNSGLHAG